MASLNQASVIGFLGSDPRICNTKTGRKMATFAVATTEPGYTRPDGSPVPERTEWHNIVLWGRQAEVAERYLRKGASVFIQGRMRTRAYTDRDGAKRTTTEIEADIMQMLDRPAQAPATAAAPGPANTDNAPF